MKAVIAFALLALVGIAAAQPTMTKCETIMAVLAGAGSSVDTQQAMITAVVDNAVTSVLSDAGLARYFGGRNGYPNITGSAATVTALKGKLISWFGGYLGCVGTTPAPYTTAAEFNLTDTHAYLKISYRDAVVFNAKVMAGIVATLASQGVNTQDAGVQALAGQIAADLAAVIPTISVPETASFCDKYASKVALAYYFGQLPLDAPANDTFESDLAANGVNWAFWRLFVDYIVIKQGIAGDPTGPIATALLKYFDGTRTSGVSFLPPPISNNGNFALLVRKLVGFFGRATGCSDQEFNALARAAGAITNTNALIDLTITHQPLNISQMDSDIFNGVIAVAANATLFPLGLTSSELNAVGALLGSVQTQVVYQAPPAGAPVAAPKATPPSSSVAVPTGAPKSSAASVVASIVVVASAAIFAILL